MAQIPTKSKEHDEDDLNKLMPLHFRNFTKFDAMEGDTVRLDEYFAARGQSSSLGSELGQQPHHGNQGGAFGANNMIQNRIALEEAAAEAQAPQHAADRNAGGTVEQENAPTVSDTLARYLSKPRYAVRGQKRQGTGRVPQKRTFGRDLKQLSRREEDDDSEAEWEARDQELARQKAERAAQRQREKESQQQTQSVGGKRQSVAPPAEDMVLDSEEEDGMDDCGAGVDCEMGDEEWGQQTEEGDKANGAWKSNPLFDSPHVAKQPASKPVVPPPQSSPLHAESEPSLSCPPTQTPNAQPIPQTEASISAQVQKITDAVLAKVGAAVSRGGTKSDGGTQTTPSLDLSTLEGRPRNHPPVLALPAVPDPEPMPVLQPPQPSPKRVAEGSPHLKDVSAAMAMAAQMAEDIDFPALEGSPPQGGGSVGSSGKEEAPRKLAFGSPVEAARNETAGEEKIQPEVVVDSPEAPLSDAPTTELAVVKGPPEGRHALVRAVRRKPLEKNHRLKAMHSRKSLAGAGLKTVQGVRRSTRVRTRPLEYWRNEVYEWERSHDCLPTVSRVVFVSPDPIWPRNDCRGTAKKHTQETPSTDSRLPCKTLIRLDDHAKYGPNLDR